MIILIKRIFLGMILTFFVFFLAESPTYGQKINIIKKEFTLNELFSEIRKQTGYDFIFTTPDFNTSRTVTIKSNISTLPELLNAVFADQRITYHIRNKTIAITDVSTGKQDLITGFVGDKKTKQGLPMATVAIKGTKSMVQTNNSGRFTISIPPNAKSLEFRLVGYKTTEIAILPNMSYNVYLTEDEQILQDIVVTGIVERKEGNFTGSSTTISGPELKKISSNNIFAGITAIDPAFRILPNNIAGGNINQLPEIQMRGSNSFPNLTGELSANPNSPLFILDGFEVTLQRIADLDMNLINSITLLKDASATSMYGSRGANGVMVITTVVPKPGQIQVTFNNDFRLTTPDLSVYNLLNAEDKLNFEQRVGLYTSTTGSGQFNNDVLYNIRYKAMLSGVNTDWLQIPVQNGYSNRSSLYLSGGDQSIRYALQVSGDLQSGVMKGQTRNNYSGQFDLNYNIKNFQFKNSIRVFQNKSNESPYGDFSEYITMNPYWAPYDANGKAQKYLENYRINNTIYRQTNPLYDATLNSINSSDYFGISNNFNLRYSPLKYLYFETRLSLNKQKGASDQFYSAQDSRFDLITDLNRKGSYTVGSNNSASYESLTSANLDLRFGKHQIYSNIAANFSSQNSNFYSVVTEGFPYDQLDNLLFAAQYQANGKPSGDESTVRRIGYLYSGSYTYDNRFLTDISVRRDGSSQYGEQKRYGTFWSVGIGWNIHNEQFFKGGNTVNRLKLRASYGSTGSLNIPAYSSQFRYNFGVSTSYFGELGATLSGLGNENLSWQNVYKANIGLDAVLFKEKLDLRLDLYRENTQNALTQITLAPSTGFSSYSENLGEIQNTGLEFSARYKILQEAKNGLLWSVNVNGFTNKNILKKLSNKLKSSNDRLNSSNTTQVVPNVLFNEGQSLSAIYVVRSLGVDPATGSEVYLTKNGEKTYNWDAADKVAYGDTQPKWSGNFGTNFMYKGIEIGLIFNYQYGGQLYNQTLIDRVESVDPKFNVDRRAYDLGWSAPGDISQYTRIGLSTPDTKLTSRFVQDNDILNLSSASIGYNFFRQAFIKKLGLRSLQLTAITNDVFRVSTIQIERGITNPFARTYSLSLRAGF
jgi:TonB-linked SusC/RagA family outer membrane protein